MIFTVFRGTNLSLLYCFRKLSTTPDMPLSPGQIMFALQNRVSIEGDVRINNATVG